MRNIEAALWILFLISLTALILCLAGCQHKIDIPIAITHPIKMPLRPSLAIKSLESDSTEEEIVKAYVESLNQSIAYSRELEDLLASYR